MSNRRRFPIGFWNYTSIEQHAVNHHAEACVKGWADAGMAATLTAAAHAGARAVERRGEP